MAIFKENIVKEDLKKTSEHLETAVIVNSSKLNEAVTNNISGYKWKVDFYNQILGRYDPPKPLDVALNSTLQSYRLIENVELILNSPITSVATTNINGDAYIDIRSAVHKHDMFIAEIHNKVGIFYVDEVRAESYEDNTIYNITFRFYAFTSDKLAYDNIISKIATTYIFNPNYRYSNQKAILLKKDAVSFNTGIDYIETIMLHYYQSYFNTRLNMLVDTKDCRVLLDLYLNRFVKAVFPSHIFKWCNKLEYHDLDEYNTLNIYDSLIRKTKLSLLDKLYISEPPIKYSSVFYKDILKVCAMSNYTGKKIPFYTDSYFIPDEFYNISLDEIEEDDSFSILLYKFINNLDILNSEVEDTLNNINNDEYKYYKIPILSYIYLKTLEQYKV